MNRFTMRPGDRFMLVRTHGKMYWMWHHGDDAKNFNWTPDEEDVYAWVTNGEKSVTFSNRRLQR